MKINIPQRIFFVMISLMISLSLQSQSLRLKKANKYFKEFSYDKAVKAYEDIEDKTPSIYRNLAKSYLMLGEIDKAESNYSSLMSTGKYEPEDVYAYASVLLMNKKYDEAANWMEKYYKLRPDDSRAQAFMENPLYYRELLQSDPNMALTDLNINTSYEDFSPVYYKDNTVVFASSRDESKMVDRKWNGNRQPYLDLYIADLTEGNNLTNVRKFNEVVNKQYHDAPATFNADGDYMLVTRNIYNKDNNLQENKLWLYESHLIDGSYWDEPEPLYFNDIHFSTGQASLSPDGKVMYFVSDRPGGFGGTDIYKSVKGKDGKWSAPENLGSKINSEGNEMFPYYDAKGGYLFFSSDGWPGLGGLDIFVSKVKFDGSYTKPQNLGSPINSNRDDFSFIYNEQGNGFLSSNREGGKGDDDIYSFKNMPKFQDKVRDCYLSGTITDKKTQEPLGYARVILTDKQGNKLKEMETKPDGKYAFGIDCDGYYKVLVLREPYEEAGADIDAKSYDNPHIIKDFVLENPVVKYEEEKQKDMCSYKLPTIYYDLDKFYIRFNDKIKLDGIVKLMNEYPEMRVEVGSHTDSRASKAYNIRLSKNRTMSAIKYLTDHGISRDRLVAKWYGESRPVNGCVDGVKCTEAQHQMNRRTEFKILNCEENK